MNQSILSRWRTTASAQMSAPTSVDPEALARGAEVEEYNVDSHEKAVGVALRNLKQDPNHYGSIVRLWLQRRAVDSLDAYIPKVLASYKKDRAAGLDHERALEHAMGNWQMAINMRRTMAEQPDLSDQEITSLRQRVEQAISSDGGGGNTGPEEWIIAHNVPMMSGQGSALWRLHMAKAKKNPAYEKETERIRENKKKPEAKKRHEFKPAEWTHPNGHPRCLVCGGEEIIGGVCNKEPSAKDYADFEKELDSEFPDRVERRKKNEARLAARFERGEITHADMLRRVAMTYESEVLLGAYYSGKITQTDLDQRLQRLRMES